MILEDVVDEGAHSRKYKSIAVIPDVPDLAPDANRSIGARLDDPYEPPKRSPETRYDE